MHILSGHNNGYYFFYGREDVKRCPACKSLLDKWNEDLACVPIPRAPKYEISYSYDGVLVVTQRFREVVEGAGITGLVFTPLQRGLFAIRASSTIAFDPVRRQTRFEGRCESCGTYTQVAGATPAYFMPGATLPPMGFARTDIEFGSNDGKSPMEICGDEAAKVLRAAKFRSLELWRVKDV